MAGISYEIGAVVTLKDMTVSVWKKLQKQQEDFKKSIKETKNDLESAFSSSISIKLDTSSFMSSINEVKNQVNNIQSTSVEVNVHINKKEEEAPKPKSKTREEIDEKKKELKQAFNEKFPFKVDNSPFLSSIRAAKKELDRLKQEKLEVKAKLKLEKQQRDERSKELKLGLKNDRVEKSKQDITKFISSLKNKDSRPSAKNTEVSGKARIKSLGKKAITAVKENKPYYMTLALKDMASEKIKSIASKPKAMTVNAIAKTASALSRVKEVASTIRKPFIAAIAVKEIVTEKVKAIKNSLSELGKKVFSPVMQLKDNIVGKVGIAMVKSGAELEQQQVLMKQAMGENNKGKSDSELSSMSTNYMKEIRDSGASNGFDSKDIVQAGTKALGIAGGDTGEAMNLVKMAQDMAALNPGKSAEDAMEALEELRSGGTSKLKDFNIDVSQDDAKNLGLKGVMNQKLKPQFGGGSEKMGQTGIGLFSTIKEKVKNKGQDIGLSMLEKMKPVLSGIIKILDSPALSNFSSKIGAGISFVFEKIGGFAAFIQGKMPQIKEFVGNAMQFIGNKFGWIGEIMPSLQQVFEVGWNNIATQFTVVKPLIEPLLSILADGIKIIFEGFQLAFPYIMSITTSVWEAVAPIFESLGGALSWIADGVNSISGWIGDKVRGRNVDGSHANGLKNVPFDGYIAELHKGEAVIPASQNPYNSSTSYSTGGSVVFTKIADQIVVREEADIDRIADKLVRQLQKTSFNKA